MIRSKLFHAMPIVALALASAAQVGCKNDPKPVPAAATSAAAVVATPSAALTASATASAKPMAAPAGSAAATLAKTSLPLAKQQPVPKEWIELKDESKGFDFSVPAGTKGAQQDANGTLVYMAMVPPPMKIGIVVLASSKPIKALADDADDIIAKVFEETNVKVVGTTNAIADGFQLIEFTSQDTKDATSKSHWKALMATNGPDSSYIMIVGSPETEFKANEPTIDEVWGSFDMLKAAPAADSAEAPAAEAAH